MKVFVTVGTTKFDGLINKITNESNLSILKEAGFTDVLLQVGESMYDKSVEKLSPVRISSYKYKDSLLEDITDADFIISHAGAGTCLEVLSLNKPLLVVVNETLMGNHQTELAERLAENNYAKYCPLSNLEETLKNLNFPFKFEKLEPPNTHDFVKHIDHLMGFC